MTDVHCQPSLTLWGDASIAWIAEHIRHPLLSPIMVFFSELGHVSMLLITVSLSYWLWNKRVGKFLCYGVYASILTNIWLKGWVKECRPPSQYWMENVDVFSFPSGHAQVGMLFWCGFAYYTRNRFLSLMCILIGIMMALSRSYLGVHYPQDIGAGALLGLLMLALFVLCEKKHCQVPQAFPLWGQAVVFITMSIPYFIFINDPKHSATSAVSSFFGFWLGCQFEKKTLQFKTSTHIPHLISQSMIGIAGILLLYTGGNWLLHLVARDVIMPFRALQHFTIGLWISFLAPALCLRYHFVSTEKYSQFN